MVTGLPAKSGFRRKERNGIIWWEAPAFSDTGLVRHGFSTRVGGVSTAPYASLNLAGHVGDKPADVLENRRRFSLALGVEPNDWVTAEQVHSDHVAVVTAAQRGQGAVCQDQALAETDAMITRERGAPLAEFFADCVPVMLLDPATPAIGLAHAGWKGTAAGIAAKTVLAMTREFGTRPADCLAAIGPSIGPCCYAVGEAVAGTFINSFSYGGKLLKPLESGIPGQENLHLDLWEANRRQLIEAGLPAGQIAAAGLCTRCNAGELYSFRADQGRTGRLGALLMLV